MEGSKIESMEEKSTDVTEHDDLNCNKELSQDSTRAATEIHSTPIDNNNFLIEPSVPADSIGELKMDSVAVSQMKEEKPDPQTLSDRGQDSCVDEVMADQSEGLAEVKEEDSGMELSQTPQERLTNVEIVGTNVSIESNSTHDNESITVASGVSSTTSCLTSGKNSETKVVKSEGENIQNSVKNVEIQPTEIDSSPVTMESSDVQIMTSSVDVMEYRQDDSGEESDESSSSSISTSSPLASVSSSEDEAPAPAVVKKKEEIIVRTKGEYLLQDLPPIDELMIDIPEDLSLKQVGVISSIVGTLVIIQSVKECPALDADSILFVDNKKVFGQIFETFGPVRCPLYSVRFNSTADIEERGVVVGMPIYYAPEQEEYTHYVFLEQLRRLKGSDASWEHNNEPPVNCIDFSDDEKEREAKAKRKPKKTNLEEETDEGDIPGKRRKPRKLRKKPPNGYSADVSDDGSASQSGDGKGAHGFPGLTQWPPPNPHGYYRHPPPPHGRGQRPPHMQYGHRGGPRPARFYPPDNRPRPPGDMPPPGPRGFSDWSQYGGVPPPPHSPSSDNTFVAPAGLYRPPPPGQDGYSPTMGPVRFHRPQGSPSGFHGPPHYDPQQHAHQNFSGSQGQPGLPNMDVSPVNQYPPPGHMGPPRGPLDMRYVQNTSTMGSPAHRPYGSEQYNRFGSPQFGGQPQFPQSPQHNWSPRQQFNR